MATNLDLEEQEQLAEIKHFWNKYGNLITWTLVLVLGSFAAWNGWQYWQRHQAAQASALYDQIEGAALAQDAAKVQRAFDDIRSQFGRTTYAQQAGLVAATSLERAGQADGARAALEWVAQKAGDEGLQATARLRLAALHAQGKAFEEAHKALSGKFPASFKALEADRRGDVLNLEGKKAEAKVQYRKALEALDARDEYRRIVEVKLAALGGDTAGAKP